MRNTLSVVSTLSIAAVILSACSFSASVGSDSVDSAKLEKEVATQLKKKDVDPTDVTCSKDLKAKVDAKTACTYDAEGLTIAATVTVDSVKDGDVNFTITRKIKSVSTDLLEQQVGTKLSEQQLTPSSVDCPDPLKAVVAATASCTLIANDLKYSATVTATAVTADNVNFDVKSVPPAIVPTKTLQAQVAKLLAGQIESGINSVSCPDELIGTVGKTVNCAVNAEDGRNIGVVLTVTSADFFNVNFDINQR